MGRSSNSRRCPAFIRFRLKLELPTGEQAQSRFCARVMPGVVYPGSIETQFVAIGERVEPLGGNIDLPAGWYQIGRHRLPQDGPFFRPTYRNRECRSAILHTQWLRERNPYQAIISQPPRGIEGECTGGQGRHAVKHPALNPRACRADFSKSGKFPPAYLESSLKTRHSGISR